MSWAVLLTSDPDLAAVGRRLLGREGIPIAFLATVTPLRRARISPVYPIFAGDELYLSIGAHTPKAGDLASNGTYALHAFLGEHDEEFQVSGRAHLVEDHAERTRAHSAIQFPVYNVADPVFRLDVDRCLWSRWDGPAERPSQRRSWAAPSGDSHPPSN